MMKPRASMLGGSVLFAAALLAAAFGCGSSEADEGDDQKQRDLDIAHDFYVERVHVAIASCVGCHAGASGAPRIMAQNAEESYTTLEKAAGLIAAPKTSPLVQVIHSDPAVTIGPEQRSILTQWLSLEANARSLEGAIAKPKTLTEAYQRFADCMNFDVWSYYRMGDVAFAQTDSEGPCLGCHSTGQGSAWLSAGSRETFEKMHDFPFIQKIVVGKLEDNGSFETLQPSNRLFEKANEACAPEATSCHPRFGLPPNVVDSVKGFVDTTLQNLATDTCNSGIVVPQQDAAPVDAGDGG